MTRIRTKKSERFHIIDRDDIQAIRNVIAALPEYLTDQKTNNIYRGRYTLSGIPYIIMDIEMAMNAFTVKVHNLYNVYKYFTDLLSNLSINSVPISTELNFKINRAIDLCKEYKCPDPFKQKQRSRNLIAFESIYMQHVDFVNTYLSTIK